MPLNSECGVFKNSLSTYLHVIKYHSHFRDVGTRWIKHFIQGHQKRLWLNQELNPSTWVPVLCSLHQASLSTASLWSPAFLQSTLFLLHLLSVTLASPLILWVKIWKLVGWLKVNSAHQQPHNAMPWVLQTVSCASKLLTRSTSKRLLTLNKAFFKNIYLSHLEREKRTPLLLLKTSFAL